MRLRTRDQPQIGEEQGRRELLDADGWRLMMDRGAGTIEHPGGTLGAHLRRTGERLASYGVDDDLVVAGRCHAAYGTAGFDVALLTLDERDLLRERIGVRAEALVHEYCSCDRRLTYPGIGDAAPLMHDRWSGRGPPAADGAGRRVLQPHGRQRARHRRPGLRLRRRPRPLLRHPALDGPAPHRRGPRGHRGDRGSHRARAEPRVGRQAGRVPSTTVSGK